MPVEEQTKTATMQTPMVSVIVPVFNQRDYVERCLRSIASQKCDFPIEVIVGDDLSTDGTRDVLRRLEPELPDWFHILLRPKNMGLRGENNCNDLLHRCRGRYMAILEGDDFWTYDGKLQAQVDFLESHPDYSACYHHCVVVGADSKPNGEKYPECPKEEYTFKEFFYMSLPGQIGTSLYRRESYLKAREDITRMRLYDSYPGDRRNAFFILTIGRVCCMNQTWSAYRHVVKGGSSYSSNVRIDEDYARQELLFGKTIINFAESRHNAEAIHAAKMTYYRTLLKWSVGKVRCSTLHDSLREIMGEKDHRPSYLLSPLRWYAVLGARALLGRGVTL